MPAIVLIGPAGSLTTLGARVDQGSSLRMFTDAESREAIEHIVQHKPGVVAVERQFSATSRGAAFIDRIKDDPSLAGCDVRIVSDDGGAEQPTSKRKSGAGIKPAGHPSGPPGPLDRQGTRRTARIRMTDGLAVTVDGNPAVLVDISTLGAQLLSSSILKPNQRVRIALSEGKTGLRCAGAIAWASFEMPQGQPPRYRAGVRFTTADADALAGFAERHKAATNGDGSNGAS